MKSIINRSLLVTPLTFIYLLPTWLTYLPSLPSDIACHGILALSQVNTCSSRARPTIIIDHSETRSPLLSSGICQKASITIFEYDRRRRLEKLQIVSRTRGRKKKKRTKRWKSSVVPIFVPNYRFLFEK